MTKRNYLLLFVLGLLVGLAGAYKQSNPGYMDAYYYYYSGQQLADGTGFNEMILWNYLDEPAGLPHPSHSYWMPATSILAAGGIELFSGVLPEFKAAQILFVLIVALIPPASAGLAYSISGRKKDGWLVGILAAFTGAYQPYWTSTDSIGLVMLLGALFFLVFIRMQGSMWFKGLLLGILAGLMHLTRVDGLLWLGLAGLGMLLDLHTINGDRTFQQKIARIFSKEFLILGVIVLAGYSIILVPWFLRNLNAFGTVLAPNGSRTLWVVEYNELYSYPTSILTPQHLLDSGWKAIIEARGMALWENFKKTFISIGMVLPGMISLIGFWRWRKEHFVHLGIVGMLILYLTLSLLFPFSGIHGSYFHAAAAFVPLGLAVLPAGIDVIVKGMLKRFKSWEEKRIRPFLVGLLVFYVIGFSGLAMASLVIGMDSSPTKAWDETEEIYQEVNEYLDDQGAEPDDLVVSLNPPAFTVISGKPSLAMPNGGLDELLAVVQEYGVRWVLIEETHPKGLTEFYKSPSSFGNLKYLATFQDIVILEWVSD